MVIKVAVPHQFKLKVIPDFRSLFFSDKKDIHYIGGSDILPAPLETEEERKAIRGLGTENDEQARKMLIEHNLRLVVYIAKKFDNTGVGVEDLISIGTIGLIKAINTFDPDKNIKLATYASRCIENEILMYLRRNSKTKMEVSIDEPLNVDWDGNELLLSDILGTEEDAVYKDLENDAEKKVLIKAIRTDDHPDEVRSGDSRRRRKDTERGGRYSWYFPVLHIQIREKDYAKIAPGNGEVFLKMCYNKKKKGLVI